MKIVFPETVAVARHCSRCGRTTQHEKIGTNHVLHFLIAFSSFFVWAPVWIWMAIVQRTRQFECQECLVPSKIAVSRQDEMVSEPA